MTLDCELKPCLDFKSLTVLGSSQLSASLERRCVRTMLNCFRIVFLQVRNITESVFGKVLESSPAFTVLSRVFSQYHHVGLVEAYVETLD